MLKEHENEMADLKVFLVEKKMRNEAMKELAGTMDKEDPSSSSFLKGLFDFRRVRLMNMVDIKMSMKTRRPRNNRWYIHIKHIQLYAIECVFARLTIFAMVYFAL